MNKNASKYLLDFVPPIMVSFYRNQIKKDGWFGDFSSWENAKSESSGYDGEDILEKVKNSLLKVKNGEAAYERDSKLFDKIEYSWPLSAALMWVTAQEGGKLNLLDFGGSLGSSYFQNKQFLKDIQEVKWNVVEQPEFVECGKQFFENEQLKFHFDIDSCIEEAHPHTLLLLSVIQYLDSPYKFIEKVISHGFKYIIIDRTSFTKSGNERLTIQKVSPKLYKASYPCWFFDETKFIKCFSEKYQMVEDFETDDLANIESVFKGYIFKRKI